MKRSTVLPVPKEVLAVDDEPTEEPIDDAATDTATEIDADGSKGGRPRLDGMPAGLAAPTQSLNFPRSRYRVYKTDHNNREMRPQACFRWWQALPTWAKDRLYVYVYRDHPVLLPAVEDPQPGSFGPGDYNYIDKISGNEPLTDELDILNRYGCGSYKLMLNDTDKPGSSNRTVCNVFIQNVGGGHWKENPPTDRRINDRGQLDVNNPANTAYVSYLRGIGELPEQLDAKQEKENMASVQVIESVVQQNRELQSEVINMARAQGAAAATAKSDALPSGGREALEVVSHGAKLANDMVSKAAQQSNEMLEKSRLASTPAIGADPMTLALAIVRELKGGDAEVMELRRMLHQQQQTTIDGLTGQVNRLIDLQSKQNTPVSPFASVTEGVSALKTLKETLDDIRGESSGGGGIVGEAVEAVGGPKWLNNPIVGMAIETIGKVATAFMMARQQPQPPPAGYPPAGYPPQQYAPQPHQPAPQGVTQMPQPQQQSMVATAALPPQVIMAIRIILSPLISALTLGQDGGVLAEWAIDNMGQVNYDKMTAFGPEKLVESLYTYPESANALAQFDQAAVMKLAQEFCNPQFDEGEGGAGTAA